MDSYLWVKPLGTVSPYCYKEKNCPGFLVNYDYKNRILLDCGNGISRYLDFKNDLKNLNIIISHLHPDHYGDLLVISQTSYVLNRLGFIDERIKVYIPEVNDVSDSSILDFNYLMQYREESYLELIPYKESDKLSIGDMEVSFCRNPHQVVTYSTKIEVDGIKLVYSSDTGYIGNCLEEFANDADLLICESTFLRGQPKTGNNHLYAYEAGKIAKSANVDKLLLTHFWPDIKKEDYVREAKNYFNNTEAAREGKSLMLCRRR